MKLTNLYATKSRWRKGLLLTLSATAALAIVLPVQEQAHANAVQSQSSISVQNQRAAVKQAVENGANLPHIPGIVAVELKNGQRQAYAAGESSVHDAQMIKVENAFRIGSITKTFTAVVLLQLAGENKLSLDDSVEKWLPGVVQGNGYDGSQITIRQLLNHTSGVANYTDLEFINKYAQNRYQSFTPQKLIQEGLKHAPYFTPGTGWNYSNTNYVLAGLVIEKVTGETYGDQVQQRILTPLQLTRTYVPDHTSYIPWSHARGYMYQAGQFHDVTEINPSFVFAAGDMISTVDNLNTFFQALLSGKVLNRSQLEEMFTVVDTGYGIHYGLGIMEQMLPNGQSIWGHGGSIDGWASYAGGSKGGNHVIAANMNVLSFEDVENPIITIIETAFAQ
ncbi:serine hydrolase domain-containing protein [Paenibacillus assamensis]|uniref:serine hydrolase domain-containing protein n=1 Tax=Paenibacillus assamensis TaxID=311244 RepID=UPI00041DF836|nr:serine hydrolase domain-containing protein [Paenibacillus assamensis]